MPTITQRGADPVSGQVTIANGASLSDAALLGGVVLHGIIMPAAWTAADLTFQVSIDGGATWVNLFDSSGSEVDMMAAASTYLAVDPLLWLGIRGLKIRSGTSGVPVNQLGDRILTIVTRPAI